MLLAGEVEYFDSQHEPGTRHACPDQIVMSKVDRYSDEKKTERYSDEKEYRFAFAIDKDAFAVNNVSYSLAHDLGSPNYALDKRVLILGNLSDICRTVSVKGD